MAAASSVHNQDVMISLVWVKAHQRAAPTHVGAPQVDASTRKPMSQCGGIRRPARFDRSRSAHTTLQRIRRCYGKERRLSEPDRAALAAQSRILTKSARKREFALRLSVEDLMAGEAILIVDDNPAN